MRRATTGGRELKKKLTSLGGVTDTSSRKSERVDSPGEVGVPVDLTKGETLSDRRLVNLDGEDSSGLEVVDFVSESESKLLALNLAGDINTVEGPVEAFRKKKMNISDIGQGEIEARTNMVTGPVNIPLTGSFERDWA